MRAFFGHTVHGLSCKTCEEMYEEAESHGYNKALVWMRLLLKNMNTYGVDPVNINPMDRTGWELAIMHMETKIGRRKWNL